MCRVITARRLIAVAACVLLTLAQSFVTAQEVAAKRLALLVGINEYQHAKLPPLKFAVNDVTELGKVLEGAGYEITLLTDDRGKKDEKFAPTKANIDKHLHGLARRCRKGDTFLLALTG